MSKQQTVAARMKRVGELVRLKKVGINWFAKCPWCNDPGHHLLFPASADRYVCLNQGCRASGTIEHFFVHFNVVDKSHPKQLRIPD